MLKKLVRLGALAGTLASPLALGAQNAVDPFPSTAPGTCLLSPSVFSVAPTKCYGFFEGNSGVAGLDGPPESATASTISSSSNVNAYNALRSFGFAAGTYNVIERIGSWNGTTNFTTQLSGWTVMGFHWGNYPNSLESGTSVGNVSAWYLFDFGSPGTKDVNVVDLQGISNATVIYTDGVCTGNNCGPRITNVVPEPSTYALMTAGLLGIFGVARRRRNSATV